MPHRNFLTANDAPGQHAPSWYADSVEFGAGRPPLAGDRRVGVCIIGGGFTGLSAALHLAEAGLAPLVLEAHRVGWGASGRNGGQLGSGQRMDQSALERQLGPEHARRLWDIAEEAKQLVRDRVARYGIDCHLKPGVIHAAHRRRFVPDMHAKARHLQERYDYDQIELLDAEQLRFALDASGYWGGTVDHGAGHLHPLRLAVGLARAAESHGATIHEGTRVTRYETGSHSIHVHTESGSVHAEHLIIACNGYLDDLSPAVADHIMPINNYILATEPLGADRARDLIRDDMAVADSRFVVNYYRLSHDHRLLFGGGEGYATRFPPDIGAFVRRRMLTVFPQLADTRIDYGWGGTLAITLNRMPALMRPAANVFSAGGYSGHGVALANWAGTAMAEAIRGTAERFDTLAAVPTPRLPGGVALGTPLLTLALLWYALRDRI